MSHLMLKFNHGVEIGARLAYVGHYFRTGDKQVLEIAKEEMSHQNYIQAVLNEYGQRPSILIDLSFILIGTFISLMCRISPIFMLNWVAKTMEVFAVFSYTKLARKYPAFDTVFLEMAKAELRHEEYFRGAK